MHLNLRASIKVSVAVFQMNDSRRGEEKDPQSTNEKAQGEGNQQVGVKILSCDLAPKAGNDKWSPWTHARMKWT